MTQVYLPIFPLPDAVFFPHTLLPLHVFEARYRAMVSDCLGRDRRLAVVGLKPGYEASYEGKPTVYPVAGAGEIVRWERQASGRFNILVRGDCRIRIDRELATDTLYRFVRATVLPDTGADRPAVGPLATRVRDLSRRILRTVERASPEMDRALAAARAPGALCDQVAAAMVPGTGIRQRLLEEPNVERRLRQLLSTLAELLKQLREER